jgi:hypothetical protein
MSEPLKLSKLLQLDRFEEDLNITRVQLYAHKSSSSAALSPPAPTNPQEDQAAHQRALEILAKFRAEQGL